MRFAIIAPEVPTQLWKKELEVLAPKVPLVFGAETDYADEVVCAMVWKQKRGALSAFKNLKLIFSMGAGVDHVLADDTIPQHLPICRVKDPQMAFSMSNYLLMAVMNHHRSFYDYQKAQQKKHWAQFEFPEKQLKIGVLGTGFLGMDIALKLHHLGFAVSGYSTRVKQTPFPSYAGADIDHFLATLNVLICLVPYTPKTKGLLNYELFKKLKAPTYLINVSRGQVQIEKDLIKALDEGLLSGAFLDVFEHEPLPSSSPLWSHPNIQLTPHIASLTYPRESVLQMLDCLERVEKGLPLPQQVDRTRNY
jgi:glyoxylate/hydroxypyruvate reductase A